MSGLAGIGTFREGVAITVLCIAVALLVSGFRPAFLTVELWAGEPSDAIRKRYRWTIGSWIALGLLVLAGWEWSTW